MQQDMKFKCLVSNKVVNFADKEELEETIDACIGDVDAVMEELNPNQEELITYLVTKLVPTKQQNKQLSLMLKTKAWKNECTNTEYTMQNIFIREQLEKRFLFGLRLNDGHGGFYSYNSCPIEQSPPGMFENHAEYVKIATQFEGRNSIKNILIQNCKSTKISESRNKSIAKALHNEAFHMLLPGEMDKILPVLATKKRGKYIPMLLNLLQSIQTEMNRFANVKVYPCGSVIGDFRYYAVKDKTCSNNLHEKEQQLSTYSRIQQTTPSTPPRQHVKGVPTVTPNKIKRRPVNEESDIETPKKKGKSQTHDNCQLYVNTF